MQNVFRSLFLEMHTALRVTRGLKKEEERKENESSCASQFIQQLNCNLRVYVGK